MSTEINFTINSKLYEEKLKDMETKLKGSTDRMDKDMQKVGKKGPSTAQVMQAGAKAGGAGGAAGKIGDVAGVMGLSGGAGMAAAGIGAGVAVYQLAIKAMQQYQENLKIEAEMAAWNTKETEKYVAAREKQRTEDMSAVNSLSELAKVEKISNVQKLEAIKSINQLTKSYGNLGVYIDKATGKIVGMDNAQRAAIAKGQKDEVTDIDRQIKALKNQQQAQQEIYKAGDTWYGFLPGVDGWKSAQEAAKAESEIIDKIIELERQKGKIKKDDRVGDFDAKLIAELEDRKTALDQALQDKITKNTSAARKDAYDASDDNGQVSMRQEDISVELQRQFDLGQKILSLSNARYSSEADLLRAEAEVLRLQSEYEDSLETQRGYENDIYKIQQKQREEQQKKYDEQQKKSADFNKDLKRQLQDAADTLTGNDFAKTLRDAQEKKGAELNADEVAKLRMLSELQTMNRETARGIGLDMGIQTNALTRRGGFSGGGTAPTKDEMNRKIADYNRRMVDLLGQIRDNMGREERI